MFVCKEGGISPVSTMKASHGMVEEFCVSE